MDTQKNRTFFVLFEIKRTEYICSILFEPWNCNFSATNTEKHCLWKRKVWMNLVNDTKILSVDDCCTIYARVKFLRQSLGTLSRPILRSFSFAKKSSERSDVKFFPQKPDFLLSLSVLSAADKLSKRQFKGYTIQD